MRARLLKPGFFDDAKLCRLPYGARLLFAGLWCLADREGRLLDIPRRISADVFPFDEPEVDHWLAELVAGRFIARYSVGDGKYIQIINFKKHQAVNIKERPSEYPPVPIEGEEKHVKSTCSAREKTVSSTGKDSAEHVKSTLPPEAEAEAEAVRGRGGDFDLSDLARRIHARHPARRGTAEEVERAIALQVGDAVDTVARAAQAERNHAGWCASEDWAKENHRFVPLLPRWIREGRIWEEPPRAQESSQIPTVTPEMLRRMTGK